MNGDMNLSFCNYFSQLWDIYERAFPLTLLRSKDIEGCPWMTPGLRNCIRKKASLYRMYVCGTIIKADYTYYKDRLTTLIRRVKRMYYCNLFQRIGKDSSKDLATHKYFAGQSKLGDYGRLENGHIFYQR